MFIRFILYSFAFYFIMKVFRIVVKYFTKNSQSERPEVRTQRKSSVKVEKKDIIEAEFEDITEKEK